MVYLPGLLLPLLHISLNAPSLETAFPRLLRLSTRTVACSTSGWELHFSSTAGVESGFEGAQPMVVGRQVEEGLARLDTFRPLESTIKSTIFAIRYQMAVWIMRKAPVTVLNTEVRQRRAKINIFISSMQGCQNLAPGQAAAQLSTRRSQTRRSSELRAERTVDPRSLNTEYNSLQFHMTRGVGHWSIGELGNWELGIPK